MKIRGVILDTTSPFGLGSDPLRNWEGEVLLDYQIGRIRASGRKAIVVLNQEADDLLRVSKFLFDTDLVYRSPESKFSPLQSGLQGAGTCAFYLPIGIPFPSEDIWAALEKEFHTMSPSDSTQLLQVAGTTSFPLLITRVGTEFIKKADYSIHVEDLLIPQFKIREIPAPPKAQN